MTDAVLPPEGDESNRTEALPETSAEANRFALGLMAVCVLGLVLRALHFDIPMRYDETFTFTEYAREGWRTSTTLYNTPNNHVLHSLLVGWVTSVVGIAPAAIRLPAFLAGCMLIPISAWVGYQAHSRRAGIVAATLVATSPVLIEYSTNARGYTLMALATLLAVGIGQRLLKKPTLLLWTALAEVGVIGFFTLPVMAIPWTGIMLWLGINLIAAAEDTDSRVRVVASLVTVNILAGTVTLALYWGIIANSGMDALLGNRFVAAQSLEAFFLAAPGAVQAMFAHWARGVPIPLAVGALALGVAGFRYQERRHPLSLTLGLVFGAVIVMLLKRNHGEARIWLWAVPLLSVGIGVGVAEVSRRIRSLQPGRTVAGFAGIWAVIMSAQLVLASPVRASLETGAFPEGDEVALRMMEFFRPGDLVMSDFISAAPLEYYVNLYRPPEFIEAAAPTGVQRTWVVLNKGEAHRVERLNDRVERMRAPPLAESTPVFSVGNADVFLFGRSAASADPRLLEAVDWYTGVAGYVDDKRAQELLLEVLDDTNSALARMWLARCHSRGRMGFLRDEELAKSLAAEVFQEIRELAATDEPEAIFLMGTAYDEGLGVEENPTTAFEWYSAAAEVGHVLAAHNMGNAYRVGRGVPQDAGAAVFWWTQAAEKGDAITQLRLGEAYEAGHGVVADVAQAIDWYRQASERGNADARAALGRLGG